MVLKSFFTLLLFTFILHSNFFQISFLISSNISLKNPTTFSQEMLLQDLPSRMPLITGRLGNIDDLCFPFTKSLVWKRHTLLNKLLHPTSLSIAKKKRKSLLLDIFPPYSQFFFCPMGLFFHFHLMMCDKISQYTTKHSTPKLPNMLRSVINFFCLSPSQYILWLINLIVTAYHRAIRAWSSTQFFEGIIYYYRGKKFPPPANPSRMHKAFSYFSFRGRGMSWGDDNWQYWSIFLKTQSCIFSLCKSTERVCWPASNEYLVHSPVLLPWFWYMSYKTFLFCFQKNGMILNTCQNCI